MEFKRGRNTYVLELPKKSLLILSGEARYSWQHQITQRKFDNLKNGEIRERKDRISLTFRKCLPAGAAASLIERYLVKDVYDHIAEDFSKSRYKMWPLVENFVNDIPNDALVGDFGCGNGKNLINKKDNGIGLEVSINLAKICKGKIHAKKYFHDNNRRRYG
jgi:alkylated DNA repair protein alkB family protein 8